MGKLKWYIVPALAALARNVKGSAQAFTPVELSAWATSERLEFPCGMAAAALGTLKNHGYVRPEGMRRNKLGVVNRWFVTPLGLQAAQAALRATPAGPAPDTKALATCLWNLLRIRKRITAADAAQTLVDAGDAFDAQVRRIGTLLAAWARHAPKAVAVAQKREAERIRYVLVQDVGRWPPPSRAGQLHPSDFAHAEEIPAMYRKAPEGSGTP
jgi:hypothetical protein